MRNSNPSRTLLVLAPVCLAAALTLEARAASAGPAVVPRPQHIDLGVHATQLPPSSYCLQNYGIQCLTPTMLAKAYNFGPLRDAGIDGSGRTIVIVDSFGSPTIASDLHAFDQEFGLPDPPSLTIIQPSGPVPPFDPNDSTMQGWGIEASLDVEYAHAFAPGAAIILVETPVAETEGVQGFPEMIHAENYVIDHDLGDVISQSFAATEETFPNNDAILDLRSAYKNAAKHHVTVLGAAGDWGATGYELNGVDFYPYRVIAWPASDPLVTAVGGTVLTLDDSGNRLAPDAVWNDYGAGGGGVSAVFRRPDYQDRVKEVVGKQRGIPDISMNGACLSAVWVYWSFPPEPPGWGLICGTSESTPEFAGIVAMADQAAGRRLGLLGPRLYELHQRSLVDITTGNNTYGPFTNSDGNTYTVAGYDAGPGYDLASGRGTIDATKFVWALVEDERGDGDD
jgi:subtilase family serine protease